MAKESTYKSLLLVTSILTSVSILPIGAVNAQDEEQEEESGQLLFDEIEVTATRRSVNLKDLAAPVSALSGDRLQQMGASAFSDYARTIPSLSIVDRGPGRNSIIIRGISVDAEQGQITTSAVYIDDAPVTAQFSNPDVRIVDLDRVEVLRGPQGTLYGASALGGALRYITRKPNTQEFEGFVDGTARITQGAEAGYAINGAVNIPVIEDKLAFRTSAFYDKDGGYVDNYGSIAQYIESGGTTGPVEKNVGDATAKGARAALRFTPTDSLTLTGTYFHQVVTSSGTSDVERWDSYAGFGPLTDETGAPVLNDEGEPRVGIINVAIPENLQSTKKDYRAYFAGNQDLNDKVDLITATVEYATDFADFIYAFTDLKHTYRFGSVSANNPLLGRGIGLSNLEDARFDTRAHELRAVSNWDKRINWLVGAYYQKDVRSNQIRRIGGTGFIEARGGVPAVLEAAGLPKDHIEFIDGRGSTSQKAAFGEVTWDVLPDQKLQATVGLRYAEWKQQFLGESGAFADELYGVSLEDFNSGAVPPDAYSFNAGSAPAGATDSTTTLKFNVAWRPKEDLLIFAQAVEGFRLVERGVNRLTGRCINSLQEIYDIQFNGAQPEDQKSDSLWNYEVGVRTEMADGRVSVTANAYRLNWKNIQFEGELPGFTPTGDDSGCEGFLPNGNATINGLELETAFLLSEAWQLSVSGGITDAKVTRIPPFILNDGRIIEEIDVLGANVGTRLSVPKYQFNAGFAYEHPEQVFGDYNLSANFDMNYTSSYWGGLNERQIISARPSRKINSVFLAHASIAVGNDDGLSVRFAISNLLNAKRAMFATGTQRLPSTGRTRRFSYSMTRPRTFSINIRKEF